MADQTRPLLAGGEILMQEVPRSSGGGEKFKPQSLEEAVEKLMPQVASIRHGVEALPNELRAARVVIEAAVLPNYLAPTYFPGSLFSWLDLRVVGSRATVGSYRTSRQEEPERPTKVFMVAGTDESIARMEDLLGSRHLSKSALTARQEFERLQSISLPTVTDVLKLPARAAVGAVLRVWESVLHPGSVLDLVRASGARQNALFEKWISLVARLGGEVEGRLRREVGGLPFVPVRLSPEGARAAAAFNPLRAIRPMPSIRPITRVLRAAKPIRISAPPRTAITSDVRVAVFDSGADNGANSFTDPFCTTRDLTTAAEDDTFWHGCCVTSTALYGELPDAGPLSVPPAHVDHFRVWPTPDPDHDFELDWMLDRIKETIEANPYPIVNLSLGPDVCVDDDAPHRWTAELDRLASEYGVVFVAAAGNNGNANAALGLNRLLVPGDIANGIAVGACTTRYPQPGWVRADYSAVGPGREGSHVRPTVVSFGGQRTGPFFEAIGPQGELVETSGTSLATPVVVHELASLAAQLPPVRRTSNNLRVFVAHFAERGRATPPVNEVGFGRIPARLDEVLECSADELTLLYEGQVPRDRVIGVPLPVPPSAVTAGKVKLRWTVAITSPTDPADTVDYTQATVELQFRPNSTLFTYKDPATNKIIKIDARKQPALYARLTAAGVPTSLNPVTRPTGAERAPEWARRGLGKWDTIKRGSMSLRAATLYQPRFDLTYLARQQGALVDLVPPLEFSLLVTIAGAQGSNIYDRIRAQLPQLPTIRQRVQTRVRQQT